MNLDYIVPFCRLHLAQSCVLVVLSECLVVLAFVSCSIFVPRFRANSLSSTFLNLAFRDKVTK